ncbi:MAG: VWA domain-containing protein [Candidatus Obscuribacterales bacterium]|nr:VWA domain-containing protein [Candidatus Obscuribacterales bacterium]
MGFLYPQMFAFFLAVPAVLGIGYVAYRLRLEARKMYGQPKLLERYLKAPSNRSEWLYIAGWVAVSALLAIAAAGPYLVNTPERVPDGTVQAVMTLDVSKSMLAEDYRLSMPAEYGDKTEVVGPWGSRLDMAKYQIGQVMIALQGNQVGLVNYMGEGFSQADLCADYESLRWVLKNWVKAGNAPGNGSNYAEGLKTAIETLQRDWDKNKTQVIVLFSDGGYTGEPADLEAVLDELVKLKIKLVVIGIGTPGANHIPLYDANNQLAGYLTKKDDQGQEQLVTTSFDGEPLRAMVAKTGGAYLHVEADKSTHQLNIDWKKLADVLGGSHDEMRQTPIFQWFVGAAGVILLVLSAAGVLLRSRTAR